MLSTQNPQNPQAHSPKNTRHNATALSSTERASPCHAQCDEQNSRRDDVIMDKDPGSMLSLGRVGAFRAKTKAKAKPPASTAETIKELQTTTTTTTTKTTTRHRRVRLQTNPQHLLVEGPLPQPRSTSSASVVFSSLPLRPSAFSLPFSSSSSTRTSANTPVPTSTRTSTPTSTPPSTSTSTPSPSTFSFPLSPSSLDRLSNHSPSQRSFGCKTFFDSESSASLASTDTLLTDAKGFPPSLTTGKPSQEPNEQPQESREFRGEAQESDAHRWPPPPAGMPATTMPAPASCTDATANTLAGKDRSSEDTHMTSTSTTNGHWRPESAGSTSPFLHRLAKGSRGSNKENRYHTRDLSMHAKTRRSSLSQSAEKPPALTREEFEALPVAIQRKYFSTLERLRFAQGSGQVDGIYQHYDAITARNFRRRKALQDRSVSETFPSRIRRRSLRKSPSFATAEDSLFYANLPDKIKKRQFSREEQVVLAAQLRQSVILDAADEAIYKIGRRASGRQAAGPSFSKMETLQTRSFRPTSQEPETGLSSKQERRESEVPQSFYDSFRWLDEEEDLDLRLYLDDYHANLRECIASPSKDRRPSFRRHMSISKMPFSRPSVSTARPATKDNVPSSTSSSSTIPFPILSPPVSAHSPVAVPHMRRKSRTLSLITPKHAPQPSVSSIDPAATHYQDPEARLKLRVYLASPQKFDEAIEFGFPSMDAAATGPDSATTQKRRDTQPTPSVGSDTLQTFLDDDDDKLDCELASLSDPESPKTPDLMESTSNSNDMSHGHSRKPEAVLMGQRPLDSYAQVPVTSREMTLRMTLTRPDLRACEEHIYGWQQPHQQNPTDGNQKDDVAGHSTPVTYIGNGHRPKESLDHAFGAIDHWGPDTPERGVMKRFWNRVRRS